MIERLERANKGDIKLRFRAWKNLIITNTNKSPLIQLKATNDFFNQFTFSSDSTYKGESDYWKSPDEFIIDAEGDCEDFAIAKYFTLSAMGIPIDKLRITYVKAIKYNQAHMVLTYYPKPNAEPLVLDNLESAILPASKRSDLIPIYSFNGNGLWLTKKRGEEELLSQSPGLNKWQQIIERIEKW